MSRRFGGSSMDRHGQPARAGGRARRVATLVIEVVLALAVGAAGGIVLYLALGVL